MVTIPIQTYRTVNDQKGRSVKVGTFVTVALALFLFSSNAEARRYHHRHHHHGVTAYDRGSIVSHPSGCPRTLFCACGASVRIFGHAIPNLFAAASWFKFPRTIPAPGMVAVRKHHVWVLESHVSGDTWIGYDANSGGHQTRIHARRLAGYVVVNPHS